MADSRFRLPQLRTQLRTAAGSGLIAGFHRRTLVEWLVLTMLVMVLAAVRADFGASQRLDLAVYDIGIAAQQHAPRDDILIVSIDDESLSAVGRWPWRRSLLAGLVDRLADGGARVIGLDVLLVEPDWRHPEDDEALAVSMARAGNVIIPALAEPVRDGYRLSYPLPALGADVGHINIATDVDGLARHLYLQEGLPGQMLDHFVVRLVQFGQPQRPLDSYRQVPVDETLAGEWHRRHRLGIPFAGPIGTFRTVSAIDVLSGAIPPELFRDKLVLVGAGATGLGDMFSAPLSKNGAGISGVELLANAAQALLDDNGIVPLPRAWYWPLTLLPVLLACLAALLMSPRDALLVSAAVIVGLFGASVALMHFERLWFSPVPAILACLVFYPLWSWRRQESALTFLSAEVARLEREPALPGGKSAPPLAGGTLDTRMSALYRMITRQRDLRRLLSDGLENLPDATVICDADGSILLANAGAVALSPRLLSALNAEGGARPLLDTLIADIFAPPQGGLDYWDRLRRAADHGAAPTRGERAGVELQTHDQRAMLLRGAPLRGNAGEVAGFSISFIDITQVRLAERQREETLRFISHDMRSPQASILALVELQADPARALEPPVLLERIRHHAGRTLALADDFIQLARAESQHLRFAEVDLTTVLMDAADSLWALAQARRVTVAVQTGNEEMMLYGEAALLMRAVSNLIDNAVKYSPPGGTVTVRAGRVRHDDGSDGGLMVSVSDQGPGIAPEEQARLFQPFSRLQEEGRPVREGSGLGLLFVKTVVERHGGHVGVDSAPGRGTTFTIALPG